MRGRVEQHGARGRLARAREFDQACRLFRVERRESAAVMLPRPSILAVYSRECARLTSSRGNGTARRSSREEIRSFVSGATDGTWPDYQASALLMAIVLRGMTPRRPRGSPTRWCTRASASICRDIPGAKVDKHSTGGVGDKTSLILAPLAAACGLQVPMMSGRGLGHTGGTLDKLEAIPGFRVNLSLDEMRAALARVGCAMIGQTSRDRAGRQEALRAARRDRPRSRASRSSARRS